MSARWTPRRRGLGWLVPVLGFTLLTIFMTWPLPLQLTGAAMGTGGDSFYFTWLVGWFEQALFRLHRLPIDVPFLNYPEGWNLAFNEVTPIMALIGAPFSALAGPVFGYNISILVSYVLSGLGAYFWVRRLTNSTAAATIAGAIFAFAPYRMWHGYGHLNLMGTQWFPWYFWSLDTLLQERRWAWRPVIVGALMLGLIAWTSQYYLYMTAIVSALYVLGYVVFINRGALREGRFWRNVAALGVGALPLVALGIAPYLQLRAQGIGVERPFEEARRYSASVADFFRPSPLQPIWGAWIQERLQRSVLVESTIYIGLIAVILALIAFWTRSRADHAPPAVRTTTTLLVWTSVCTAVLAMGVDLQWLGEPIIVDVPQFLQRWHPYERTFIPLPGYFLFKYLPLYNGMRVWARYGIYVNLFVAVLAGVGAAYLLRRVRQRWRAPLATALLALVLLDFYSAPVATVAMNARPVDHWLATQPDGAVAQFPLRELLEPVNIYYTRTHGKPFIGSFFSAFASPQYDRIAPVLFQFPSKESVDLLRDLRVRYVLVDRNQYPNFEQDQIAIEALGLRLLTVQENQYVYALPAP